MGSAGKTVKDAGSVLVGGLIYSVLNWVPIFGALSAGAFTGYSVGGGFGRGFKAAVYSAAVGTLLTLYLLLEYAVGDLSGVNKVLLIFMAWVLVVWHMAGMLLCGIGGGFGAVGKDIRSIIPQGLQDMFEKTAQKGGVDYIICPNCGQGNVSAAKTCVGCSKSLQ
jgi:hypothetical protein